MEFPEGLRADEVGLQRVDLARDFAVSDAPAWVHVMAGTYSRYGRKQYGYFDQHGHLTSIHSGSKMASLCLYAKAGAHPDDSWTQKYSLRFEVQLKDQQSTRTNGLGSLERLTDGRAARAAWQQWNRSRLATVRMSPTSFDVISKTDHQPFFKAAMVGQDCVLRQGQNLGLKYDSDVNQALIACGLLSKRRTPKKPKGGRRLDWRTGLALEVLD